MKLYRNRIRMSPGRKMSSGLFVGFTSTGRRVLCFCNEFEDAHYKMRNSLNFMESLIRVSKISDIDVL